MDNTLWKFKNFIISIRDESGIYKFNQKSWNLQDEGIATIWVLLALLKVYEITNNSDLLNEMVDTVNDMHRNMVDKLNSLLHNLGDNYWYLNAASTYAFFASQFLDYHYDKEIFNNYINAVELCVSKITPYGYFPYSGKRHGTYLLLYNPIVIYTLENSVNSHLINHELKIKAENAIENARKFILKQMDEGNFFVEFSEQKKFSRYIISNLTSLVALKNKIPKELECKILKNISYLINDKLYLCRNSEGEYFNGNLYEVSDVLTTEVFYWLLTYLYN